VKMWKQPPSFKKSVMGPTSTTCITSHLLTRQNANSVYVHMCASYVQTDRTVQILSACVLCSFSNDCPVSPQCNTLRAAEVGEDKNYANAMGNVAYTYVRCMYRLMVSLMGYDCNPVIAV
jgi:hypothetical protein